MKRRTKLAWIALALVVLHSSVARAQESRFYVDGAALRSWQGDGDIRVAPDTPKPGVSGEAFGVAAAIGLLVGSRVNIALEISLPNRFDAQQSIAYSSTVENYRNAHRDLIISGALHYCVAPNARVSPELVGGLSFVNEDTLRQTSSLISRPYLDPPVYGPYGPEADVSRNTFGLVAGVDVPVRLGSRFSFVPGVRFHIVRRADDIASNPTRSSSLHLGPHVWRAAAGLRVGL